MNIVSSELWPYNFNDAFRAITLHAYTDYTFRGGRGSCKSTTISEFILLLLMQHRSIHVLAARKYQNTLRDSVYAQFLWSISKLGLDTYFKCTTSPLQITYRPTGQKIYFRGCDDPVKIKSIKTENGYIGILWLEESSEFTPDEVRSIKQSVERGGDKFWIIDSYNPPVSARNWKNVEVATPNPHRYLHTSDYRTVPVSWLSEAFIYEAESLRNTNKRLYDNEYLGIATGTGLNVFDNIVERRIEPAELLTYEWHYQGIDWGYFPDPFMYAGMSYSSGKHELYLYDELCLRKCGNEKASNLLFAHLSAQQAELKKIDNRMNDYNVKDDLITADNAEPKSVADFREYGWNIRGDIKGKGSVDAGYKWLQSLNAIVIDRTRTPNAAAEFTQYEYNTDRNGNVLTGYPQGQEDHYMSATRYGMEPVWKRRGM